MKLLKLSMLLFTAFLSSHLEAARYPVPGGGEMKYRASIRLSFTAVPLPPSLDKNVSLTCKISTDGKSGYPSMLKFACKDGMNCEQPTLDGRRFIDMNIGEVTTGHPNTFHTQTWHGFVPQYDYVEFTNLDKMDTITIEKDSCYVEPL